MVVQRFKRYCTTIYLNIHLLKKGGAVDENKN